MGMYTLKLNHLDEHQVHKIRPSFNHLHHAPDGIMHQLLKVSPLGSRNLGKDCMIRVESQKYRFEYLFLT